MSLERDTNGKFGADNSLDTRGVLRPEHSFVETGDESTKTRRPSPLLLRILHRSSVLERVKDVVKQECHVSISRLKNQTSCASHLTCAGR
jgi:hypothetical protein